MAEWPKSAGFAERHVATMDIMRALKANLDLPQSELSRTASELEEQCLKQSKSKDEYQRLVNDRKATLVQAKQDTQPLEVTTGVSERNDTEARAIGQYKGVYHAQSLNSVIYRQHEPVCEPKAILKVVSLSAQSAPHDIEKEAKFLRLTDGMETVMRLLSAEQIAGGISVLRLPYMRYDLSSLAEKSSLSLEQKRHHLKDMFSALEAIHEVGIIHRDVKPSNVLLDSLDGPAYLSDFGISWNQDINTEETEDSKITDVGTGCYRAPEVLFGCHNYSTKFDMWAAGCTMAEVLAGSGKTLFDAGPLSREDFLGSDLRLINSMFQTIGTPTNESWPEAREFRDWNKIQFKQFPAIPWAQLLPGIDDSARETVAGLVVFESSNRLSASQVLKRSYFRDSD